MLIDARNWCSDPLMYFQKEDASRITTIHKEIAQEICASQATRILDYGSGDGKILNSFPSINDYQITLFDPEETAMSEAFKVYKDQLTVRFESDSENLPSNLYDAVIFCNVIMVLQTIEELLKTLQTIKRTKNADGVVYAGMTHPCFLDRQFATYNNDFTLKKKPFNYFQNGQGYQVYMTQSENTIVINDVFWNLSKIINSFMQSGFKLLEIKELKDVEENDFPPFLILKFI